MPIAFVLVTFFFQTAAGMMMVLPLLPARLIDYRFFRSISFWSTLFLVSGLGLKHFFPFHLPEVFGAGAMGRNGAYLSLSHWMFVCLTLLTFRLWWKVQVRDVDATQKDLWPVALFAAAAVLIDSFAFRPFLPPQWAHTTLVSLHFLSTSLLLGGFLTGMIFGHSYLIDTEMPKRLLLSMAWILIAVLALRILAFGGTLGLYSGLIRPEDQFLDRLISFSGHGIFFWQRVLVGLLIPGGVVGLIWGTARLGSNQSATGIMYVGITFVFIGELIARYLFFLSAIPL